MTKMAAMPIYGKNPSKIIFSETNRLISRKLGVRHRWLKYSNVYINHDPVMTLTKFMARSTWVACASELGKLLKCHLKEKANRKLANGQNIEDSEKRKWPKGLSAPALELNTIIFKHVYWYMQLISGERLQDHWSSGSGDAKMDSPGHSAQYCTYTMMEYNSKDILACEILDKRMTNLKSAVMEKEGLRRCLKKLIGAGIKIRELCTDGSTSIAAMISKFLNIKFPKSTLQHLHTSYFSYIYKLNKPKYFQKYGKKEVYLNVFQGNI